MKNTANVKRYYAMSLIDGRTMLVTRELLTNPDYRVITEELAKDVEAGRKDWRKIAFELRQRDSMNPDELVKRAEQEKVKNMRKSVVTRENVEQFETKISDDELGSVFDGKNIPDEKPNKADRKNHEGGDNTSTGSKGSSKRGRQGREDTADAHSGESEGDAQGAESFPAGEGSTNINI